MWKDKEQDRARQFTRRAALLAGGKILLLSTLVGRMYYLQVIQAERYQKLAEDNRINLRLLAPPRGVIYDRHGEPLAVNQQNYRVVVIAEETKDVSLTLDALNEIIPIADRDRRRVMREIRRKRAFVPVTVRENLTWEEVSRVEVNSVNLPGVSIEVGLSRAYPYAAASAHVLGYVAAVSEAELTGEAMLELPDVRIGKNGVEKLHDLALRGSAGASQVEVNALGRVIRELNREEGRPGRAVTLTLDIGLQDFVAGRLQKEESASAALLSIPEGEVLALSSHPVFDPVAFGRGLTSQEWQDLLNHPRGALNNKAIAGQYPPGSTFKMCVALAALEGGILTSSHRVSCPGHMDLGETRFHCWEKRGHGSLDMFGAIARSCDVYFYDVARRVGVDRIAAMARKLGLGQATLADLPGEKPGLVPSREWKLATTGVTWQQGDTVNVGIGQGYILATPLQLAVMTARIASGLQVRPRLTRWTGDGDRPFDHGIDRAAMRSDVRPASLGLSAAGLAVVQRGMDMVINSDFGTAKRLRGKDPAMAIAGKSGTAQVKRITQRDRDTNNLDASKWPWRERHHALFLGYAPMQSPRYAAAVVVEHGGGGSSVAGPIVRDILREAMHRKPMGEDGDQRVAQNRSATL
jgi:penicillin-binding protein 2